MHIVIRCVSLTLVTLHKKMQTYKINLKDGTYINLTGSNILNQTIGYNRLVDIDHKSLTYLGMQSAGIAAKFRTKSKSIKFYVQLANKAHLPFISAIGEVGIDLYVFNSHKNEYIYCPLSFTDLLDDKYEASIRTFEKRVDRDYILYLPSFVHVKSIFIEIEMENDLRPINYINKKKIIVYGTSITQGAYVSRAGNVYTNILSRKLNQEVMNLGFAGAAMLEIEMANKIGQIDNQELLIIDVEANAGIDKTMEQNLDNFLKKYYKFQPNTPIILCSRPRFAHDIVDKEVLKRHKFYKRFIKDIVKKYDKQGKKIFYKDLENVYASYGFDATIDGKHPSDFGNHLISKAYLNEIKKLKREINEK